MTKKITKKERYAQILTIAEVAKNPELVEFINHEIELLENKNSSKGQTKTQKENENIKATLYEELKKVGNPVTISEFQSISEVAGNYTNQKISALFRQMENIEKTVVKGKTYFKAV